MSLFEQFPYTNFHELNLDWLIQAVKDYGESIVLSVNGQTGEVVLYQDPNVRFPDVDNSNWSIVRTAAGHELGIQFQNGMAFLRFDNDTERIYTNVNPPPYPVTSVDGQTGAVQVFPNADTVLPPVDNTRTIMRRQIKDSNNQDIFTGVQAEADALKRLSGTNLYTIYDQGNQPPYPVTSVNGSTGAVVLAIPFADVSLQEWTANDASPSNIWEMSRYTLNGALATLRLTTANGLTEGYLEFYDEGTQTTVTKKILTTDDIPSSAGVLSINGLTGVVTLYGTDIDLYSGSQDTVKDAIDYTRSSVAYREDGAIATQNIPVGSYVIWEGEPYISTMAISIGDALSSTNLSSKPAGVANDLKAIASTLSTNIGNLNTSVNNLSSHVEYIQTTTPISDLDTIPVNSQGRISLASTVSPTGAAAVFDFHCYGNSAYRVLKVVSTYSNMEYINSRHNSPAWKGWRAYSDKFHSLNNGGVTTCTITTSDALNAKDMFLVMHRNTENGLSMVSGTGDVLNLNANAALTASVSGNAITLTGNNLYYAHITVMSSVNCTIS